MTIDATEVQVVDGLAIDDLVVRFGGVTAVDHLSLRAPLGAITGLIGPNGAGKSTVLHAITGLVAAHAGDVRLGGRSILGRPPEAMAHLGVALGP